MSEKFKTESVIRIERSAKLMINDIFDMKYDEQSMIDSKCLSDLASLIHTILELRERFKYIQRGEA